MTTPVSYATAFPSIPAPLGGADDTDDGTAAADAALDRADLGAALDPVGLLLGAFWPWRRAADGRGGDGDGDERTEP